LTNFGRSPTVAQRPIAADSGHPYCTKNLTAVMVHFGERSTAEGQAIRGFRGGERLARRVRAEATTLTALLVL
jgi:hypothetical protein